MTDPDPHQKPHLVPMFRIEGWRSDDTFHSEFEMIYLRMVNRFGPINSARLLAGETVVLASGGHFRLLGAQLVEQDRD